MTTKVRSSTLDQNAVFPAGTQLPFYQLQPPLGWIAVTPQNDSMMRVVTSTTFGSSTVGLTGGNSYINGGHSPILNNVVASHTHTFTGEMLAAHTHTDSGHSHKFDDIVSGSLSGSGSNSTPYYTLNGGTTSTASAVISSNSAGTPTGTIGSTGSATGWQPRYSDFCIGQKS